MFKAGMLFIYVTQLATSIFTKTFIHNYLLSVEQSAQRFALAVGGLRRHHDFMRSHKPIHCTLC